MSQNNDVMIACCNCGVEIFIREVNYSRIKRDKATFYCLNGHPQLFTKNEADILREQLERAKADRDFEMRCKDNAKADAEHWKRQASAYKGVVTKLKKHKEGRA